MKTIAIIPAKDWSYGTAYKNLTPLSGKPLIEYTFDSAFFSGLVDRVLLITDSDQVELLFNQFMKENKVVGRGFVVKEPPALSMNGVQVDEVALYALRDQDLEFDGKLRQHWDTAVILQPTSPLRTAQHIDEALQLYAAANKDPRRAITDPVDTVFSVWEPGWLYSDAFSETLVTAQGHVPAHRPGRQDTDKMGGVVENGAMYVVSIDRFFKERTFRSAYMIPYYMDKQSSIEIDEPIDVAIAEAILEYGSGS